MQPIPATSGIYIIRNTQTGQVYIGASKNMRTRTSAHRRALASNTHTNKQMQTDYTTHGPDAFLFEVGELVTDAADMQAAENRLIETHAGKCYNRKPSNMRTASASERDMIVYRTFHDWRISFYARLGTMDPHILQTLQGDLQITVERIAAELQRRPEGK